MAKNPQAAAKQAKKKHAKELQRKAKKAARAAPGGTVRPRSDENVTIQDENIGTYAKQAHVPYFRAAFEICFPISGVSREPMYGWSLKRLAKLETDKIVEGLHKIGIEVSRDDFRESSAPYRSAMAYAQEMWLVRLNETHNEVTRDFVRLAAHELWTRWNDDRPSREMAVEALLHLRNWHHRGDAAEAVTWGVKFWKLVAPELTDDVRTLEALEKKLDAGRGVSLLNQLGDFAEIAPEAAMDDQALGLRAADVLDAVKRQFADEDWEWQYQATEDIARVLGNAGQVERAEAMLQDLIEKHPKLAGAYVTLAEMWAHDEAGNRRALALLERAEAVPVKDGYDYDLESRIEAIYDEIEEPPPGPDNDYASTSTQRLVRLLKMAYDDVPKEHIEEIGRRGNEAIAPLMHILTKDYYWDTGVPDEGAVLRNAFRAMGAIGTFEAGKALMDNVIAKRDKDELPEEAFHAMRQLTPGAGSQGAN